MVQTRHQMETAVIAVLVAANVSVLGLPAQLYIARQTRETTKRQPALQASSATDVQIVAELRKLETESERLCRGIDPSRGGQTFVCRGTFRNTSRIQIRMIAKSLIILIASVAQPGRTRSSSQGTGGNEQATPGNPAPRPDGMGRPSTTQYGILPTLAEEETGQPRPAHSEGGCSFIRSGLVLGSYLP